MSSTLLKGPVCFASGFTRDGKDERCRGGPPNKGITTRGESWHFRSQTEPFAVHSSLVIGLIEIETSYCTWAFFIMGIFFFFFKHSGLEIAFSVRPLAQIQLKTETGHANSVSHWINFHAPNCNSEH